MRQHEHHQFFWWEGALAGAPWNPFHNGVNRRWVNLIDISQCWDILETCPEDILETCPFQYFFKLFLLILVSGAFIWALPSRSHTRKARRSDPHGPEVLKLPNLPKSKVSDFQFFRDLGGAPGHFPVSKSQNVPIRGTLVFLFVHLYSNATYWISMDISPPSFGQ